MSMYDADWWDQQPLSASVYCGFSTKPCGVCSLATSMQERYSRLPICGKCSASYTQAGFRRSLDAGEIPSGMWFGTWRVYRNHEGSVWAVTDGRLVGGGLVEVSEYT